MLLSQWAAERQKTTFSPHCKASPINQGCFKSFVIASKPAIKNATLRATIAMDAWDLCRYLSAHAPQIGHTEGPGTIPGTEGGQGG